jgi:hypothetical protein
MKFEINIAKSLGSELGQNLSYRASWAMPMRCLWICKDLVKPMRNLKERAKVEFLTWNIYL